MFRYVCLYRKGVFIKIGLLLVAVPLILFSNSTGPIPAVTGAARFNEPSCNQSGCHNSFPLNPGGGSVTIGAPSSYTPGSTVAITVTIQDSFAGRAIWGFQISARFRNGMQAGSFARGTNVAVQLSPSGIQYANHQPAVIQRGVSSFTYTVMWTAPADASGRDVVFNAAGNAGNADGQPTQDRIFTTEFISAAGGSAPPPSIGSGGIINGATFQAGAAPGAIISIFGQDMATTTAEATTRPLPTEISGTRVLANNVPAPLFFVSPLQINAQVPFEAPAGSTVNVAVRVAGQSSPPEPLQIAATAPGIFTIPAVGTGQGAVLIANTDVIVAATGSIPGRTSRPARPGEFVSIFCGGLGQTIPPLASGAPGNAEPTVEMPTLTIGGQNATVSFSGAAPGFAGLYQINAIVPNLPAGDHEVLINIGGRQSRAGVTIRVQP